MEARGHRNERRNTLRGTNLADLQVLQRHLALVLQMLAPVVGLHLGHVGGISGVLVVISVLLLNALGDRDAADGCLAVTKEAAAFTLTTAVELGVAMEHWLEVFDAVDGTEVRTRTTMRRVKVPLDADPGGVAGLRVVDELSHVPDRADVVHVLKAGVFVQFMLFRILDLDGDALTEQLLELVSGLLRGRR